MKLADLQARLHIDKDDLDNELVEHAELYYQVATAYVEAVSDRDAQKEALKQEQAQIGIRLRSKLSEGGGKVTEAMVEQAVLDDSQYQQARDKYLDSCREAMELEVLKESYTARGFALKSLTDIMLARIATESMKSIRSRDDGPPLRRRSTIKRED